jgi:hypothetical protein
MEFDFSEIRYYGDKDLKEVIERLITEPTIYRIGRFVFGDISEEDLKSKLRSYKTVREFQLDFILQIIIKLVDKSTDAVTSNEVNRYSHDKKAKYVFITNHRNIVMEASLLNYQLARTYGDDFESTSIAIGNNLLGIPWVKDIARLNKSFIVIRDAAVQQMLENSKVLSQYMRTLIKESISSVWIAQREGRTKDGNDYTQPGLLKLLQMSGSKDFVENYSNLHIVPVAISYEKDPCIVDKVRELSAIENTGEFVKGPLDDFNSMYNGLMGQKGRVHLSFGDEITADVLSKIDPSLNRNEKIKKLADYIDEFIYDNYKLWENNYIAADIINNNSQFSNKYTEEEKKEFINIMNEKIGTMDGDRSQLERIYWKMFAYPVKNANRNLSSLSFDF